MVIGRILILRASKVKDIKEDREKNTLNFTFRTKREYDTYMQNSRYWRYNLPLFTQWRNSFKKWKTKQLKKLGLTSTPIIECDEIIIEDIDSCNIEFVIPLQGKVVNIEQLKKDNNYDKLKRNC